MTSPQSGVGSEDAGDEALFSRGWDRGVPGFYDVALRDFGLFLTALALARLATKYDPRPLLWFARRN